MEQRPERFRGGRRVEGQAPYVAPGFTTGEAGAAMRVTPAPQREQGLETWERVLAALARIMVIITCTVVLYGAYRLSVVLSELGAALQQFGTFGGN